MTGRNCVVLGAGRSGTSLLTGTLASSGYFCGHGLWEAAEANPKGFFEDREVNAINELLLSTVMPWAPPGRLGMRIPGRLGNLQRWLYPVPPDVEVRSSPRTQRRIQRVVLDQPFALKDPRFCFTLGAWRPHLPADTAFVVVFREPSRTIASTAREVRSAQYLRSVEVPVETIETLWQRSYRRILDVHALSGDWLFLHYDQVITGDLNGLEELLGTSLDRSFADARLNRSTNEFDVSASTTLLYNELCRRAGHRSAAA